MHLAMEGWTDVLLLEQGSLGCGTSWHSAGMVGQLKQNAATTALTAYSTKLYLQLEKEGYNTGWKPCGSFNIARTKDRMLSYKRSMSMARNYGVETEIVSPEEIKKRIPLLRTDDLMGGVWVHNDGVVNPTDLTMAMANKARDLGVKIVQRCRVKEVLTSKQRVTGVQTNHGPIECKYFVNCAGMWAHRLGQHTSVQPVRVPLHPCEHYYLVTKAITGIDSMMPVVRDYDGYVYLREWSGGVLAGGFEPKGLAIEHDIPDDFEFQLLPENWDQYQVLLENLLLRFPALEAAQVNQLINGPESFTPDGMCVMGEAPEVDNYYVAAGMNSAGVAMAGGVGKYMAEWMIQGEPSMYLWSVDARRFVDMHNNKLFLKDRVTETLGAFAKIHLWDTVMAGLNTGRNLRTSPLYTRMEGDAVFGQSMGYERPLYFHSSVSEQDEYRDIEETQTSVFGKPVWYDRVKVEYWTCREGVCLIDMSTYTKFELRSAGNEVVKFLQYVCSNDVDRPVGTVIHTGMQNESGGYENDCSVVRLADNHYFMIGPTAQQTRSYVWLRDHLPQDGSVQLTDVTSMYTSVNVIGPRAQELLSELTDISLAKQDFYSMTYKSINIGQASGVKAMRLTHSGEDGWMLYIPSEYALHVYDSLMAAGKNYGIRNAGYYALRALRTEKFYAYWGTDLTPYTTPLECGREFRVKFEVGGFIGHEALVKQKNEGIKQRLVQFLIEDHDVDEDPWPWGGEAIFRNGRFAGNITSTAYGFTLDSHICLGYVQDIDAKTGERHIINNDFILKNANFEIDIAGKRYTAKPGIYAPKLASAEIVIDPRKHKR